MTPAISVSALTKKYGEIDAVRGIDFEVEAGETFGFLGPNGAGKSTTIKILCTLADPTSGSARVAGHDVTKERDTVRRNIGLVFQDTTLDNYLTGRADPEPRHHMVRLGRPTGTIPGHGRVHGSRDARHSHSRVPQDRITSAAHYVALPRPLVSAC